MRITRTLLQSGAVVAALTVALTGCGSEDKKDDDSKTDSKGSSALEACDDTKSGSTSDAVEVTGDFGKEQKATFKAPLEASGTQRTVVDEGDGDEVEDGTQVNVLLSVYSGKSGKAVGPSQPVKFPAGDAQIPDAFRVGVECVPLGSRSVVTVSAKEVYGEAGNPGAGIAADDTMVIVTDVIDVVKPPALPEVEEWKDAPEVTFDKDGKPTVKLEGKPADKLLLKVLEEGDGDVVKSGDSVTVDYQGTSWDTKQIFDQSYGKQPATFTTDGVVQGFGAALVGQKVGSKVIVTIPPALAYGEDKAGHQLGGQTLVFVIDIQKVG